MYVQVLAALAPETSCTQGTVEDEKSAPKEREDKDAEMPTCGD